MLSAAKASCSDSLSHAVCHSNDHLPIAQRSRLMAEFVDLPRRHRVASFLEGPTIEAKPSSFVKRRLDGGVKDPDGGAIIEDTSCKRPEMQENAHGTGLKAGIQLGLSTIFFLGIPIGIVGGFFYQIYEKAAEVRQKHEAEVAAVEKAKVAEAKAKAKAKFKMKAKAKPKAKAQEEESYSEEED